MGADAFWIASLIGYLATIYSLKLAAKKLKGRDLPIWIFIVSSIPCLLILSSANDIAVDIAADPELSRIPIAAVILTLALFVYVPSFVLGIFLLFFVQKGADIAKSEQMTEAKLEGAEEMRSDDTPIGCAGPLSEAPSTSTATSEGLTEQKVIGNPKAPSDEAIADEEKILADRIRKEEELRLKIRSELSAEQVSDKVSKEETSSGQNKLSKKMWQLIALGAIFLIWLSQGAPNPALYLMVDNIKQECLEFAQKHKRDLMIFDASDELLVGSTWVKNGRRVVEIMSEDTEDETLKSRLCLYGKGQIRIPGILEEAMWR